MGESIKENNQRNELGREFAAQLQSIIDKIRRAGYKIWAGCDKTQGCVYDPNNQEITLLPF